MNIFRGGDRSQLCGLSIKDPETGEWVRKWDGADNTNFESTKGGLSDSMKRAAYQWGIGRYLYNLDSVWVPIKEAGKTCIIEKKNIPKLPAWALPKRTDNKVTTSGGFDEIVNKPIKCEGCGAEIKGYGKRTDVQIAKLHQRKIRYAAVFGVCKNAKPTT